MKLFRNEEVKKIFALYGVITVIATAAGWLVFGAETGSFILILCLLFWGIYGISAKKRYDKMARLTMDIDRTLHGEKVSDFSSYKEGELALLENELSKMLQRLQEQAVQLQDDKVKLADFIADISHQIRTPLTAANLILTSMRRQETLNNSDSDKMENAKLLKSGQSECYKGTDDRCRQKEQLKELTRLLSRVEWLIEALLKLARLDAGTVVMKQETVAWEHLIEKAMQPLAIPIELKEQTIHYNIQGSFNGDFSWTAEAVGNILKNCMEHTPAEGTIWITALENPLYTELEIRDNGTGIAPEDLPHLFERFYKGKESDKQSVGIGLALAKNIICHQGGRIQAGNHPEGGAVFTIRFYKSVV